MNILTADYNGADRLVAGACRREWRELETVLKRLPLCLKASDQAGRQGSPIFDPIATNAFIRSRLRDDYNWEVNMPIPPKYSFLGTDIDAGKNGVMVEVQFSNYPFLLNNTLRAELFYQGEFEVGSKKTVLAVIVSKGGMFPASNSTLYYEQAKRQLDALAENTVFRVPIRLVGIVAPFGKKVAARWTEYGATRYSREVSAQVSVSCDIKPARTEGGRCNITVSGRPGG